MSIADKVIDWLTENTGIDKDVFFDSSIVMFNPNDGNILVNHKFLKDYDLMDKYLEFLKTINKKPVEQFKPTLF